MRHDHVAEHLPRDVPQVHFNELARCSLHDATVAEVGVLGDEDAVFRVGDTRDILIGRVPATGKPIDMLAIMPRFYEALGKLDGDLNVAEETHHATSPSE